MLDMTIRIGAVVNHDFSNSVIILILFHDLSTSGSNHCSTRIHSEENGLGRPIGRNGHSCRIPLK